MFINTDGYIDADENKALEDKWRLALDAVGDGMWDFNFATGKISFSEKWQDIFGYTAEDLGDSAAYWNDKIHPDDLISSKREFEEYLKGHKSSYSAELRYQCKNGEYKWILSRGVVIARDEKGAPLRMIGTHQDIHKRKLAEEVMKVSNKELERTRQKLEDKVKRLEELNNLIAHNLRGPAGNIKMLASVLKEIEDGVADEPIFTRPQAIDMIIEVNNAFIDNLNTLLGAAQISLSKDVGYDLVDVANTLEHVMGQLSAELHEKKAMIVPDIAVPSIPCPRPYLASILYNLLSNSLKYSRPGVVPHITISVVRTGGEIVLAVKDNGLGIDLKTFGHKIFKLNEVFHTGFDSNGVGLYMTKAQVESIGGRITVASTPGEGSLFTVYFPAE